jgi:hypothetical protein
MFSQSVAVCFQIKGLDIQNGSFIKICVLRPYTMLLVVVNGGGTTEIDQTN